MPFASTPGGVKSSGDIAPNSVNSSDIADDEIVNADIDAAAAIADSKLAQITTAGKVSGAALTSLGSIPVGAGVIPAVNVQSDWAQLGETVLGAGATSIDVQSLATRKDLRIVVAIRGGTSSSTHLSLRFNGDTGNNYGYRTLLADASLAAATANAQSAIMLDNEAGDLDSQEVYAVIDVVNDAAGVIKFVLWHLLVADPTDTSAPTEFVFGSGVWANTSAQISEVNIVSNANLPTGSRVTVYGKKD